MWNLAKFKNGHHENTIFLSDSLIPGWKTSENRRTTALRRCRATSPRSHRWSWLLTATLPPVSGVTRMIVIIVTAPLMLPSSLTLASWHLTALLVLNCDDEPEEASCYCNCDGGRQEFWNADTGEIICNMTAAYGDEKWDVTTSYKGFGNIRGNLTFAWTPQLKVRID